MIKCEKVKEIIDGRHEGVIVDIVYRTTPHNYTDVILGFKEDDVEYTVKDGYPTQITEKTKLGKLLTLFGTQLAVDVEYDVAKELVGKKCEFLTITEGKYSEVVKKSLKPLQ